MPLSLADGATACLGLWLIVAMVVMVLLIGRGRQRLRRFLNARRPPCQLLAPPRPSRAVLLDDGVSYDRAASLLTDAEARFFRALTAAAPAYRICPKVRLMDLIEIPAGTLNRAQYVGRVGSKHVDFVVCEGAMVPLAVIELDDATHGIETRVSRDAFVNRVLDQAGLRLLRLPVQPSYDMVAVRRSLEYWLQQPERPRR